MKTLVFLLVVCTSIATVCAQTRGSMPFRRTQPDSVRVLLDTVYSNGPDFAIGWNWGASLRPVNKAFGTNAWHLNNPFEWSDYNSNRPRDPMNMLDTSVAMHLLVAPSKEIPSGNYLSQYKWFFDEVRIDTLARRGEFKLNYGSSAGVSLTEGIGFRFHPELSMADTIGFTPRAGDKQGAIWGFLDKDTVIGKLTTDTTNPNFHSYVLDADTVTQWHTVLNNSWPQQRLGMWTKDTSFAATAPFNGRKMYFTIQLRRTDATDTAMTADSVLRIKIHYATCDDNTTIREIAFDSLPSPTAGNIALPFRQPDPISPEADATRGMVRPLVADPSGSQELIITRNMIPRGDSTQRDVAIMGHFKLMQKNFGTDDNHSNPFLRSESVNNMIGPKEATDAANSIYHISRMWVEVEYRGNCDVAIDWVQLGTDNYTRLTQGYYDSAICVNAKNIVAKLDSNNQHRFGNANHPNRTRIWRWYNRDEGGDMFWDGMAYTHKLLDSHTLYENGVATTYKRQLYSSGMSAVWEGTGCKITQNTVAAMYNHGYKGIPNLVDSLMGHRYGVQDVMYPTSLKVDYETHTSRLDTIMPSGTLTSALPTGNLEAEPRTTPFPGEGYVPPYPYGTTEGFSLQACFERVRWDLKKRSNYLFEKDARFMANIWLIGDAMPTSYDQATGTIVMNASTGRVITGEEASLLMWSQIILGAKGLFLWNGPSPDMVEQRAAFGGSFKSYGIAYGYPEEYQHFTYNWIGGSEPWQKTGDGYRYPGLSASDNKAKVDSIATLLNTYVFRSDELGPDWLDSNNRTGQWQLYNNDCYPALPTVLTKLYGNSNPANKWYTGTKSMRYALYDVLQTVQRAKSELIHLKLRGWFSRGYRKWIVEDSVNILTRVLDTASFQTRHPHREHRNSVPTWETQDSMFVEATVLQRGNDVNLDTSFVVGVLNRRCNPFYYSEMAAPSHTDLTYFPTYAAHYDSVANATDKFVRFRPVGSRMMSIPFNYTNTDGKYHYLRIRELGVATDTSQGIALLDTVIGQDKPLRLNFMPGEGKMLRVDVLPANEPDAIGFLAHSNQRKMVVFPELSADTTYDPELPGVPPSAAAPYNQWAHTKSGVVDTAVGKYYQRPRLAHKQAVFFHQVYHKAESTNLQVLPRMGVYYRRSKRIPIDSVVLQAMLRMMPTIEWEEPIALSQLVLSNAELKPLGVPDFEYNFTNCGYPSIVVRPSAFPPLAGGVQNLATAYIVFACEGIRRENPQPDIGVICEAILPAQVSRAAQVASLTTYPSRAIHYPVASEESQSGSGEALANTMLWKWGTPTIGASSTGNWYAWSDYYLGIHVGFKRPEQLNFTVGLHQLPSLNPAPAWMATHPSFNTYSRLHLAEEDMALVWQEGTYTEYAQQIRYTRFRLDTVGTDHIDRYLVSNPTLATTYSTQLTYNPDKTIITLTANPRFSNGMLRTYHQYPVIQRNLNDYEIDTANSNFRLGLVNYKAERILFSSRWANPTAPLVPLSNWFISRRVMDIKDYSLGATPATPDDVWALVPLFITDATKQLKEPNVSLGDLWYEGNWMNPAMGPVWWPDSAMVVNFSRQATTPTLSTIVNMVYGYDYYDATGLDRATNTLFDNKRATMLVGEHRFSQLGARYSASALHGWHLNRRVLNSAAGFGAGLTENPSLGFSSEQLFKQTSQEHLRSTTYMGFVTPEAELSVHITLEDQTSNSESLHGKNIKFCINSGEELVELTSPYSTMQPITYSTIDYKTTGEQEPCKVYVERKSDGYRFDMELFARAQNTSGTHGNRFSGNISILADETEEYRWVVQPITNKYLLGTKEQQAGIIEDVTLEEPLLPGAAKTIVEQQTLFGIVDMRNGNNINGMVQGRGVLHVYPNPANNVVSIVTMLGNASGAECKLVISNTTSSQEIVSMLCKGTDIVMIPIQHWPVGMYTVRLSHANSVYTQLITVIH